MDDAGGTVLTVSEVESIEEVKQHQENELQKTIAQITGGSDSMSTHSESDDSSILSTEIDEREARAQKMIAEAEEKAYAIQRKLKHDLQVLMRNYTISGPTDGV